MAHDDRDHRKARAPERLVDEHRRAVAQEFTQHVHAGAEDGVLHERHRAAAERVGERDDELHHAGQKRRYRRTRDAERGHEYRFTDQMIIGAVLTVLNSAIANPSLLESGGEISTYSPTADVIRQQNEINQMTDSSQIDFDRVKAEIFKLAEMKYDCCTYNDSPQKTEKLKELLQGHEQLNSLDIGLFKACVSRIWISHFCTIEAELINGVRIKNITEKVKTSRSENNVHSTQCNDNTCESADS